MRRSYQYVRDSGNTFITRNTRLLRLRHQTFPLTSDLNNNAGKRLFFMLQTFIFTRGRSWHRLFLSVLVVLACFGNSVAHAGGTCSSSTDEFIHRYVTIPQKPLSTVLVQRFLGPELAIRCMSVTTVAGPECASAAVPTLCYRKASDTLAALQCEALPQFASDANEKVTRGDRDGEDMVWVVKLDTSAMPATCFARTEEVRLLALVRGKIESSIALFVVLLIVCVVVLLFGAALVAFACYQRADQLDGAGAVAAAGPKMNYQGAQMNVAEPHLLQPNVERYLLPVRASGATEDISAYYNKIVSDPNYDPTVDGVQLDDGGLEASRAPRGMRRIMRASPPRPGDGEDDGRLQQHNAMRRQIADRSYRSRRGNSGRRGEGGAYDNFGRSRPRGYGPEGSDDDEDNFEYYDDDELDYNDPRNLLDINDPDGGEIVYDDAGRPIGRRRRRNPSRRRGRRLIAGDDPTGGGLFPTQSGWSTFGGDPGDDSDSDDEDDEDGLPRTGRRRRTRGGGPPMPGDDLNATGRSIKFVPRWMEGNFGRGGAIPDPDTQDAPSLYSKGGAPLGKQLQLTPGIMSASTTMPLAQRLNKPSVSMASPYSSRIPYSHDGNGTAPTYGAPTPVRQPSRSHRDPLAGSPRGGSVRKGIVGGRTPGLRGADAFDDDGVGADGLGQRNPTARRSASRGGPSYQSLGGGDGSANGLVGTPRGVGPQGGGPFAKNRSYATEHPGDAFQRDGARVHSSKLSLDPSRYLDPTAAGMGIGGRGSRAGSRRSSFGAAGEGEVDRAGGSGMSNITSPFECKDCGQRVSPSDPSSTFCPANGYRHF